MAENVKKEVERELRQKFRVFANPRGNSPLPIKELLKKLRSEKWVAFSFGGIPRGILEAESRYQPRDLDLVFDDAHFPLFESAFKKHIVRHNSYGGLKLNYSGLTIDAWPLSSTWAFRTGLVKDISFEKLPATTFLNIDGIIIEAVTAEKFRARRIFEYGFVNGITKGILDINMEENPHPAICFARTLHISKSFGFKISYRLALYLLKMFTDKPILELQEAEKRHYGKAMFEAKELWEIYRLLEAGTTRKPERSVRIFPKGRSQMRLPFELGNQLVIQRKD